LKSKNSAEAFTPDPSYTTIAMTAELLHKHLSTATEAELQDLNAILMAHSTCGIIIAKDRTIVAANHTFCRMGGYGHEEVEKLSWSKLLRGIDASMADFAKHSECYPAKAAVLLTKEGTRLTVLIKHIAIELGRTPADLLLVRRNPKQDTSRAELERVRQLESIAALSGGIAHDYNNLLTAILGNISLAQTYVQPGDTLAPLLQASYDATLVAKDLTQKLISFSKGGKPITEAAALGPLVQSATEFTLSGSNIRCQYELTDDLWTVHVNKTQIGQAIHNLVLNAREAMPAGGMLWVSTQNCPKRLSPLDAEVRDYVKICFVDQGPGIANECLERIFDPYFTTKPMGKAKGKGLGLSICHSIIRQHGGDIEVATQTNGGTTMCVFLPATREVVEVQVPAAAADPMPSISGHGRILVMDDEQSILNLVQKMLQRLGYSAEFAHDGDEAIALYKAAEAAGRPFDGVILDLTVRGGMGGQQAMAELIEFDPQIRGLVSSGYSNDPVMAEYDHYGFKGVVAKPYTLQELGVQLHKLLGPGSAAQGNGQC
jgi:signal transduction histidine kinase/CheY-like chemotaxis protein